MIGSTSTLSEQYKMLQNQREFLENYEREKQKLIEKHEVKLSVVLVYEAETAVYIGFYFEFRSIYKVCFVRFEYDN